MKRLFDKPAFWRKEERLKTKCLRGEYDEPREEENYSLCAQNDGSAEEAAKRLTKTRRIKINMRLKNPNWCAGYDAKRHRTENCEF